MSFRISVESVIFRTHDDRREVLLVKRADDCKVAPGVWNVPAGKVNMLETTFDAVVRETLEETELKVRVIRLLAENAFQIKVQGEPAYRNMFIYLTEPIDFKAPVSINHEHSDYQWVTRDAIEAPEYTSLMPRLKQLIVDVLN